ncbi:MAG TPA: ABC transporter ATP-binding protein, partial [Cyclobacteriaceae bacterium]
RYPYLDWTIKLSADDKLKINEVVSLVGIQSLMSKRIDELSDGQLQLVMIARALVQDCDIILLDEPTAHLDLNNRVEIMNLLRSIAHQQNKAIVVATHELDLALQTADRIWLASNKQNIITGMPEDLVLNGSFDEIFQFKGFDLKTGKIQHIAYRDIHVTLLGNGPELLWTRNALERNGYTIDSNADIIITLIYVDNNLRWSVRMNDHEFICDSIRAVIDRL